MSRKSWAGGGKAVGFNPHALLKENELGAKGRGANVVKPFTSRKIKSFAGRKVSLSCGPLVD